MVKLIDALDDVLARVAAGESLEGCLARYASRDSAAELVELVGTRDRLNTFAPAPALPADVLAARRRQFLSTARAYQRRTASVNLLQRFMAWIWPAPRTGQSALLPATWVARVAIAFVLVLSIAGGTVAAAQSSLPDSPLYGIKLAVEDARLNLAGDPSQQATLATAFASERAREMEQLAIASRPISSQISLRLQNQLDAALRAAAQAPEPEMLRLLDQVRSTAQAQERVLAQAQLDAPRQASTQDALRQAEHAMVQARQQAESGLTDPEAFRNRYRHQQSAPALPTSEATATPRSLTPTTLTPTLAQPSTTPEATATPRPLRTPQITITPQHTRMGTDQPPTSAPGPQVTGTPQQTGPGPQPTAGQGSPGPQATDRPGDGSGSGGSGGSAPGGGTRRP